MSELMSDI